MQRVQVQQVPMRMQSVQVQQVRQVQVPMQSVTMAPVQVQQVQLQPVQVRQAVQVELFPTRDVPFGSVKKLALPIEFRTIGGGAP